MELTRIHNYDQKATCNYNSARQPSADKGIEYSSFRLVARVETTNKNKLNT